MSKLRINKKKLRTLELTKNPFQALVRSIIFQQLSGKAASTILNRFMELFGVPATTDRGWGGVRAFPKPEAVLAAGNDILRSMGLSKGKVVYIKDLAAKFLDGTIDPKKFPTMSDQEIIDHLVQVKGIGEWTAHMFLIFALNRPDVLPTGDLAIRKGFMKAFNLRAMPSHSKMVALAERHKGERTYLALYLWDLIDVSKKKK